MSDNEAKVRIVGDASQVAPAIAEAKAGVESLGATTKATAAQMKESFAGVTVSVREMGIQLRETFEAMGEIREAMMAFAEAALAAFAVEQVADWAREMGEASEKTMHLAETFGMTVPQVQGLQGAADQLGMSIDTLAKGLGVFDRKMVEAAAGTGPAAQAFKALGVSAKDGKDQMTLLLDVAEKFKGMDDGPRKVALATQLFGRAWREMIPLLNLGREGIERLDRANQEYSAGVMFATDANKELRDWLEEVNKKGVELAESTNESKVAWQGLSNVLTDAFAPVLKEATDGLNEMIQGFIESYREGGTAKTVIDALTGTIEAAGAVLKQFGETASEIAGIVSDAATEIGKEFDLQFGSNIPKDMSTSTYYLNVFKDDLIVAKDVVVATVDLMVETFEYLIAELERLGQVINDVFTLDWGAIANDWEAGTSRLDSIVARHAAHMKALMADMWSANNDAALGKDHAPGKQGAGVPEPKGAKNFDPPLPSSRGHHKGKQGPSQVDQWRTELADMLSAQQNWDKDEAALTLAFWESKLALVRKGSKEELEIRRDIARAKLALHKEEQQDERASIKQREALQLDAAKTEIDLSRAVLQEKLADITEAEKEGQITATKALQLKAQINRQIYQLDLDLARQQYQIKLKALQDEQALYPVGTERYREYGRQIVLLTQQYTNQQKALSQQVRDKEIADDRAVHAAKLQSINQLKSAWAGSISQMLTGQMSFINGIKSIWQGLQSFVANLLEQIVENWLTQHGVMTAIGKLFGIHDVATSSGRAGAAAYASTAAIPIIGPALAPAAAATAAAGAASFGSIMTAAGGWDVAGGAGYGIDGIGGVLSIIHPHEMVLPASIATPLRAQLSAGSAPSAGVGSASSKGASSGAGGPFRSGDVHNHFHIQAMDGASVHRVLMNNLGALSGATKAAHRQGHFAGTKLGGR